MAQMFKGDATELKFYNSGASILGLLSDQKTVFFDECFDSYVLGELIWDNELTPLANAIPRDVFRETFSTIWDSFVLAGSFESYISVFKKIFGDDADIVFTVPAAGKLNIDITANAEALFDFISRDVVDGAYEFSEIIDDEDDNIVFQAVPGLESEYEVEQMLFEMVPAGIFTQITLTLS